MMYAKTGLIALAVALGATLGCERNERVNEEGEREVVVSPARPADDEARRDDMRRENQRDPARPAPQVKPSVTSASAVSSIMEARCDREARCDNIGADEKYKSWQECKKEISQKSTEKIGASECSGGVDSHELSECLTEIRNEGCGNPLDTLERVAACNSADLCIDTR